jgi:putative nucleotidyltransferase with HDIG domain
MTQRRILFVDDEPEILHIFQRRFQDQYLLDVAASGMEALQLLEKNGPYAVIVSDNRMPKMTGIQLFTEVQKTAPDAVRILLTAFADLETAMKAVNEGFVFRILRKPCPPSEVAKSVDAALAYYELLMSQRELHILMKWRQGMEDMIYSLVALLEKRDPYTAGHQVRVAALATAMAQDLDLVPEQVEVVRLAASVHDIGKTYVPSEFLNKPGRLTPAEFEILKAHPLVGQEVLTSMDKVFPISRIVGQHHEKLDGSGYPEGLHGEQILPEARIITVADIVEAMQSHRPYRPALGVDMALAEIESLRGVALDTQVVNSCLRLFREKGFQLKNIF